MPIVRNKYHGSRSYESQAQQIAHLRQQISEAAGQSECRVPGCRKPPAKNRLSRLCASHAARLTCYGHTTEQPPTSAELEACVKQVKLWLKGLSKAQRKSIKVYIAGHAIPSLRRPAKDALDLTKVKSLGRSITTASKRDIVLAWITKRDKADKAFTRLLWLAAAAILWTRCFATSPKAGLLPKFLPLIVGKKASWLAHLKQTRTRQVSFRAGQERYETSTIKWEPKTAVKVAVGKAIIEAMTTHVLPAGWLSDQMIADTIMAVRPV